MPDDPDPRERPGPLPYADPSLRTRPSPHDVWAEPHLRPPAVPTTPEPVPPHVPAQGDAHLASVWDEPTTSRELAGDGPRAGYADWLDERRRATPAWRSWAVVAGCALAGGPAAVLGTFLTASGSVGAIIGAVVVAPVVEELMKAAVALWVAEVRPYLFRSRAQVLVCLAAAGLGFAAIENALYLNVYVPDPSPGLVTWRWTACVALHVGCSLIAGVGVARVWSAAARDRRPPAVALAGPYLTAAAVVHALFNAAVIAVETLG